MKKYRINSNEHFNLMSMYDHLKCVEIDMMEGIIPWDDKVMDRIDELEDLLDKAYCVGALVDWDTLKRIREIKDERQLMRYNRCLQNGASEKDASLAFQV
jgi:hypothetical protein